MSGRTGATAFREMLLNAIEHGGQFDPNQVVRVSYIRPSKAIVYRNSVRPEYGGRGDVQRKGQ